MTILGQLPHGDCEAAHASPPCRASGIQEYRLGDEMLLYVAGSQTAHALNPSAVAIWELCNGTRTIEEISQELARRLGHAGDALLPGVSQGIARLRDLGLLESR
jgi:pyrroloquinoline quinone biosynthesis protein D